MNELDVYAKDREAYAAAMEEGNAILASIKDAETATAAVPALRDMSHALTSKDELVGKLRSACKELGLTWDKGAKAYVQNNA